MPELALKIDQHMGQIGIDFQQPRSGISVQHPKLEMQVTHPQIELDISHPHIERISNKQMLSSMGLYIDTVEFSNKLANEWEQAGASFTSKKVQEGEMLSDIAHNIKVVDAIKVWDHSDAFNFNLGAIPSVMPEIAFYTAEPGIRLTPGQVQVSPIPGQVSVDAVGGKVDITLADAGYLHITAVPKPGGLDILA